MALTLADATQMIQAAIAKAEELQVKLRRLAKIV